MTEIISNNIGIQTELEILLYITKLGYSVSLPYGDKNRYDQIWDINNNLIRVQIKTSRKLDEEESGITFNCYSIVNGKRKRYTKKEIDYFATYYKNKVYLIPVEECSTQKNLRFFITSKNTNYNVTNWAKNYEVEEVIKSFK